MNNLFLVTVNGPYDKKQLYLVCAADEESAETKVEESEEMEEMKENHRGVYVDSVKRVEFDDHYIARI